jgi:ring-1,2-phenylacetyl-CoA epoxidase subunit PaaE
MSEYDGAPTRGLPVVSPANMLPVQVIDRQVVAPGVVSVFMVLPGAQQAPAPYLPGQFVTLALPTPRDTLYRSYSLCGDGDISRPWEMTIKRMHMGAVSTYFYDSVLPGTLLYASLPRGTFTLPPNLRPDMLFVMVALGSGITPIMGMIRAIARMHPNERPLVQLHYSSKSPRDIIFGRELREMDPDQEWLQQRYYLSSEGNRMTTEKLMAHAGWVADRAYWYMCGPESLKHELQQRLAKAGVPPKRIFSEVFATSTGPAYKVEGRGGSGVGGKLLIEETGDVLDVEPQDTLLTALERNGYRPDFSCRAGACGACKLKVLSGQVDPVGEALTARERTEGYVLSCIARPIGDVTLASGGRAPAGGARNGVAAVAGAASRASTTMTVRMSALVGVGALLMGSWQMTNHRPASWGASAAPAPTQPAVVSTTTGAHPGATPGHVAPPPTATPAPVLSSGSTGGGGGGGPAPTPTPVRVAPTPTPVPTVCTTSPSGVTTCT